MIENEFWSCDDWKAIEPVLTQLVASYTQNLKQLANF